MKTNLFKTILILLGVVSLTIMYSCDKEDDPKVEDPVASFQFEISTTDWHDVIFANYSQNATIYSWTFGDGETSTDKAPTHTYAAAGEYTVKLTASNSAGTSHDYSETITITDPLAAVKLLTGDVSKTWKLFREGVCMSFGESSANFTNWWAGLENDGARPCLYNQTFTFGADGSFVFDDDGFFWGEYGVWSGELLETCFVAEKANMVNKDGTDVSAWLSGSHTFTYDPTTGALVLTGNGAWIGIPKLDASGERIAPTASTTCKIEIIEETGYDLMNVDFDWGEDGFWRIVYASYSDASLEPDVVEVEAPWGEDLSDITPTSMKVTFASRNAADLVVLDTVTSGASIDFAVDDPADAGATKVGKYNRIAGVQYQEQIFRTYPTIQDILLDNLTTVSIDIYVPSSNDYTGDLSKDVVMGFGDMSQTKAGWWTDHVQYEIGGDTVPTDVWKTYTFQLDGPFTGESADAAKDRIDLDMFYIGIGGSGHTVGGTFYVRNLIFE